MPDPVADKVERPLQCLQISLVCSGLGMGLHRSAGSSVWGVLSHLSSMRAPIVPLLSISSIQLPLLLTGGHLFCLFGPWLQVLQCHGGDLGRTGAGGQNQA